MRYLQVTLLALPVLALLLLAAPRDGLGGASAGAVQSHKVVFIDGLHSEAACGAGLVELTSSMRDFLLNTDWVQTAVPLAEDDFHYFSYSTAPLLPDRYCDSDQAQPDYTKKDTCWSIDDAYSGGTGSTIGVARRLNQLLLVLVDQDPGVKIDLVAHSQGGLVATYWLETFGVPENVNSIVTFDSPLGGLHAVWAGVAALRCRDVGVNLALERWFDSWADMQASSPVIATLQSAPADTKVFTMRTSTSDIAIPDGRATFEGAACDSRQDLDPSICLAPAGPIVDFYGPFGNHSEIWHSPIPEQRELLGCAVTGDLFRCLP